jgi:hypothetical protein
LGYMILLFMYKVILWVRDGVMTILTTLIICSCYLNWWNNVCFCFLRWSSTWAFLQTYASTLFLHILQHS